MQLASQLPSSPCKRGNREKLPAAHVLRTRQAVRAPTRSVKSSLSPASWLGCHTGTEWPGLLRGQKLPAQSSGEGWARRWLGWSRAQGADPTGRWKGRVGVCGGRRTRFRAWASGCVGPLGPRKASPHPPRTHSHGASVTPASEPPAVMEESGQFSLRCLLILQTNVCISLLFLLNKKPVFTFKG